VSNPAWRDQLPPVGWPTSEENAEKTLAVLLHDTPSVSPVVGTS
jgi:hypothetical protein